MPYADKDRQKQAARENYLKHREALKEKNSTPEAIERRRENLRRYKERNREKVLQEKRDYRRAKAAKEGKALREYGSKAEITAKAAEARKAIALRRASRKLKREYFKATDYLRCDGLSRPNHIYHTKLKHCPKYMIDMRMRNALRKAMRYRDESSSLKDLGYSTIELMQHIEALFTDGMSWDAFLRGEIHIDHVTPKSWFNYSTKDDQGFKDCWALSNLQPLWAEDNLKKRDSYSG